MNGLHIFVAIALVLSATANARADDFQASAEQTQQAHDAVDAYWSATDGGHFAEAYAALDANFRANQTEDNFTVVGQHLNDVAGPLVERRVWRVSWYRDPPTPGDIGVYAAFDIVARYQNIDRYCGFVIVHQRHEDAGFAVSGLEENYLDNGAAAQIATSGQSADTVWAGMAAQACPGWTPDAGR